MSFGYGVKQEALEGEKREREREKARADGV